uniref:Nicastrin n=1 Tax=Wollemia nobilis TaxID=56998 RepID=A0A0C9RQH0_9CONI
MRERFACLIEAAVAMAMAMTSDFLRLDVLVAVTVTLLLALCSAASVKHDTLESVPELEKAMYIPINGTPCVRLLNLSGEIGCANPGRVKVTAPLRRLENVREQLDHPSAVLLPLREFSNFLNRIVNEPRLAQYVVGLLVEYESNIEYEAAGFSPDKTFPLADFAPYKNKTYIWNPVGSGILHHNYNFPIFILSQESTAVLIKASASNKKWNFKYPVNVAEFDLVMQTTKSGTHNSHSCLKEGSCLPLGGYSVWSSLPPINVSSSSPKKPVILAIAAMDSMSFFRDKTLGADSPLSGMIALLAAVDVLSQIDGTSEWAKQLVFLVFTGEAWGYLGSRRFLSELASGADSVSGLSSELIDQVVELGSVGKAMMKGVPTFFAHGQQDSDSSKAILKAFEQAAASFGSESIKFERASTSNPGIPPSSLMSFLHKDPLTPGIVLEDFNMTFRNEFYHSHLDDLSNINSTSITAAASVVSRALYILANNGSGSTTVMQSIHANESLVEELLGCLLSCEPGLSCRLVNDLITPSEACANHYVGVLLGAPSSSPYPEYVDDTSRFIWNFLAKRTSIPRENSSPCSNDCENPGEVCVGSRAEHKGVCMISTTRYVPSYSTRLSYESDAWKVIPALSNDEMGKVDPVWTESFWKTLQIQVYMQQSTFFDELILLSGLVVTLGSFIAIICTKTVLMKALKHA